MDAADSVVEVASDMARDKFDGVSGIVELVECMVENFDVFVGDCWAGIATNQCIHCRD